MYSSLNWILWNLSLALIPVALGNAVAGIGQQVIRKPLTWLWLVLAPLLVFWLVFLPNTCYLFTESRHLFFAVEREALWTRARHEPAIAMRLFTGGAVALVYSAAGALTFALALRPVKRWLLRSGVRVGLLAPWFFLLLSLGVYLGLVVRFNSWDLLTRPGNVLETAAEVADRPLLVLTIMTFAFFLWVAFEVIDIWIDGFSLRWQRWTRKQQKEY
jgi:uncharacterized membrane protein